jgi:hypothetical protein
MERQIHGNNILLSKMDRTLKFSWICMTVLLGTMRFLPGWGIHPGVHETRGQFPPLSVHGGESPVLCRFAGVDFSPSFGTLTVAKKS